jgi:phage tail-like protein
MGLLDINFKDFIVSKLPRYFIREDSYKDNEDKGLLERYMALFGENIDDTMASEIEEYLNILDSSICEEKFLNHISDVLGNPPDVFNNEEQYRNLLSYIVSVYKIKGTKRAYELFFSILGFNITITELPLLVPSSNYDNDADYDSDVTVDLYDQNICQPCSFYTIAFYYKDNNEEVLEANTLNLLRAAIDFNEPINAKLKSFALVLNISDSFSIDISEEEPTTFLEPVNSYDTETEYDVETVYEEQPINFDLTDDWATIGVTDIETFEDNYVAVVLFTGSYNGSATVTNFSLVGNRLKCRIDVQHYLEDGALVMNIPVSNIAFDRILHKLIVPAEVAILSMGESSAVINNIEVEDLTFEPGSILSFLFIIHCSNISFSFALPETITVLTISPGYLKSFTSPLPETMQSLDLQGNQFTTSDYEAMESWATTLPVFSGTMIFNFPDNVDSLAGTDLQDLLLDTGAIVNA